MSENRTLTLSWLLLISVFAFRYPAVAQTIDDVGQWNQISMHDKFSSDSQLKWWFDGHYRLFDDNDGFGQSIVRPGLGLDVGEKSALWAGYGWIRTSPATGDDTDEHRLWQQWTWSDTIEPFKVSSRTRFEQRLVESADDTGLRLRQLFRVQKDLNPCSTRTLVVWDELFFAFNDTDWGQRSGFDQNRIFVGFGFKPHCKSNWHVEIGYLNQTINQPGPVNRSNHLLSVNLFRSPTK